MRYVGSTQSQSLGLAQVSRMATPSDPDPRALTLSPHTHVPAGGVFHAAIEVENLSRGLEWSYGYASEGSGVFAIKAMQHPDHVFRETVVLGRTALSREQLLRRLRQMQADWAGEAYHLVRCNCISYCSSLSTELGVRPLPEWVDRFPRIGAGGLDIAESMAARAMSAKEAITSALVAGPAMDVWQIASSEGGTTPPASAPPPPPHAASCNPRATLVQPSWPTAPQLHSSALPSTASPAARISSHLTVGRAFSRCIPWPRHPAFALPSLTPGAPGDAMGEFLVFCNSCVMEAAAYTGVQVGRLQRALAAEGKAGEEAEEAEEGAEARQAAGFAQAEAEESTMLAAQTPSRSLGS